LFIDAHPNVKQTRRLEHSERYRSFPRSRSVSLPAVPPYLIEPIFEQFTALMPERNVDHALGCYRPRIPERVVFEIPDTSTSRRNGVYFRASNLNNLVRGASIK
jgi:hypothetical protein